MKTAEDCSRDYLDQVHLQYRNQSAGAFVPANIREGEVAQCLNVKGIAATPPFSAAEVQKLLDDPSTHQSFIDCENARR